VNSVMVLNRRRFLAKYGLDDLATAGGPEGNNALKVQIVGLLHAVQYLKVPVIAANAITIIFEIFFGG
jgi:immediate early response 3-interacting protein 1